MASLYDSFLDGWAGSNIDIKTNVSQVGLNWDWPTGLSLAKRLRKIIFITFIFQIQYISHFIPLEMMIVSNLIFCTLF